MRFASQRAAGDNANSGPQPTLEYQIAMSHFLAALNSAYELAAEETYAFP